MSTKTSVANDTIKTERKDYSSLRAWQYGHDLNIQLYSLLSEYRADLELRPWCDSVSESLRDSVVQIMEAFRKYQSLDKVKRFEACLFYLNQARYQLLLGEQLGLWVLTDFISQLDEYEQIVRSTLFHFLDKKEKKV